MLVAHLAVCWLVVWRRDLVGCLRTTTKHTCSSTSTSTSTNTSTRACCCYDYHYCYC